MEQKYSAATTLLHANDWSALKIASEQLLQEHPEDVIGLNFLGISLDSLGQHSEGLALLRRAHDIDPQSAMTLENLGAVLFRAEDTRQAIKYWEAASALVADPRSLFDRLGEAYIRIQDYAAATECYRKIIMSFGPTPVSCEKYANLLFSRALYSECVAFEKWLTSLGNGECIKAVDNTVVHAKIHLFISKTARQYIEKFPARGACFVFGATGRSGTTLLQRLLNSSQQIVMFGEDLYLGLKFPEALYGLATTNVQFANAQIGVRTKFMEGKDSWSVVSLLPDTQKYFNHALQTFYSTVGFVAEAAKMQRRVKKWGLKLPDPASMRMLMSLMPDATFIFIYRNIFDTAMSYKARGWTNEPVKMKELGEKWRSNLMQYLPIQSSQFMLIKYEDLVADPNLWIERLEKFTGVTSIDHEVMGRKINIFDSVVYSEYVSPQELTRQEVEVLEEAGGWMIRELGYSHSGSPTEK